MEKILVINPGSTSTKIAVFEDTSKVVNETIRHPDEALAPFHWVMEQVDYRTEVIETTLQEKGLDLSSLTCIMARGGQLPPVPSGAFPVNQDMVDFLYTVKEGAHVSNVGAVIAHRFAQRLNVPAYVYDPVAVDELQPIARITGMPECPKQSRGHALNTHAMAHRCAKEILHKPVTECTFIVCHLGGGCSTWLIDKGYSIDMVSDDDAGFCPERCGRIQAMPLVKLCYSGKYTFGEMAKKIRGNAGLKALLGTSDAREVEARIEAGDERAKQVYEAFAYGMAKGIGELATAVRGKVDRIILTGGIAYSKMITDWITDYVGWIAPVEVMAGEYEMEALAEGGLRVLKGEEEPKPFVWKKKEA